MDRPRLALWTALGITAAVRGTVAEGGQAEARRPDAGGRTDYLPEVDARAAIQDASQARAPRGSRRDWQSSHPAVRSAGQVRNENSSPSWVCHRQNAGPSLEFCLVAKRTEMIRNDGRNAAVVLCYMSAIEKPGIRAGWGGQARDAKVTRRECPNRPQHRFGGERWYSSCNASFCLSVADGACLAQTAQISSFK